jgi:hypothetical protein
VVLAEGAQFAEGAREQRGHEELDRQSRVCADAGDLFFAGGRPEGLHFYFDLARADRGDQPIFINVGELGVFVERLLKLGKPQEEAAVLPVARVIRGRVAHVLGLVLALGPVGVGVQGFPAPGPHAERGRLVSRSTQRVPELDDVECLDPVGSRQLELVYPLAQELFELSSALEVGQAELVAEGLVDPPDKWRFHLNPAPV